MDTPKISATTEAAGALFAAIALTYGTPRKTRAEREAAYTPGPPSTSRKKKRGIGAYVAHTKDGIRLHTRNSPHPKSRRRAKRNARKAMGACGVKTNSQRAGRN